MKTDIYNLKGEKTGQIDLADDIFGRAWNADLIHQVLQAQLANRRQPWAHAKTRAEVSGGGKKPWRQKGTGRARHGSIRSPLWKGGGVTHGPTKLRKYEQKINKKMLRAAIHSSLSRKLADHELKIVDSLNFAQPKTKAVAQALKTFSAKSFLLIPAKSNKLVFRASRNIPKVKSLHSSSLNVEDILRHQSILIDKAALVEIK